MSRHFTECVKAPTETKSTPHSAYCRIVSNVIPPLDSVSYFPAIMSTAFLVSATVKLSSIIRSTPPLSSKLVKIANLNLNLQIKRFLVKIFMALVDSVPNATSKIDMIVFK